MSREKRSPKNTTAEVREMPLGVVAASLGSTGFAGAIEEQERNGQAELLNSTVLPTAGSEDPRFLELGFTFGDLVAGDPLFREATLPAGWAREGSSHSMGSYVVDERGIQRVSVFYKAAFYDRKADMHLVNVGRQISSKVIYGDDEVSIPDCLTDEELADLRADAERYVESAMDPVSGYIYTDRVPRAQALLEAANR